MPMGWLSSLRSTSGTFGWTPLWCLPLPNEGIHALSHLHYHPHLPCKFPDPKMAGDAKAHGPATCSVIPQGHELDLLIDQSQLTYKALLSHCQLLKSHCKQYQKVKEKGWANLNFITAVTSMTSSIHTNPCLPFPGVPNVATSIP